MEGNGGDPATEGVRLNSNVILPSESTKEFKLDSLRLLRHVEMQKILW
jgi:hypothetical protein